jgi:cob(I)alamin adenosyltransferase
MSPGSSITTRIGDKGTTQLFSGETVSKNCSRTNAYGDLDELVSVLGVARAMTSKPDVAQTLITLQRKLFVVGAELATTPDALALLGQRVDEAMLAELDAARDALEERLPPPTGFILPGGTPAAAHIDLARSIARRCERKAVGLRDAGELDNSFLIVWLNRLSDYLWLLARWEEGGATLPKDV